MNAESMPLKHDHQQYADRAAAAGAPFRTTKTTTRTTLVTRAIAVCGVVAAVAGVTYLSTGSYPRAPVASGATGGVLLLRDGSTSTSTQEAFMKLYPELLDLSPADQTVQYQAYLLYSNGMTVDELDAYYHIHDDQQEGGGAGASGAFRCCKDKKGSSGCRRSFKGPVCRPKESPTTCRTAGLFTNDVCCRTFPDNRVGYKNFVWETCT